MKKFHLKKKPTITSGVIFTRINPDIKRRLVMVCASAGVSQNDFTVQAIEWALAQQKGVTDESSVQRNRARGNGTKDQAKGKIKLRRVHGHKKAKH